MSDEGLLRVLQGRVYAEFFTLGASVGNRNIVGVFNPLASGILGVVRRVSVTGASGNNPFDVFIRNGGPLIGADFGLQNLLPTGPAPTLQFRAGAFALTIPVGGETSIARVKTEINREVIVDLPNPPIIPPGYELIIQASALNIFMAATVHVEEIPG